MHPFVSIILPVRNEERYIEGCLRSIIAQDYPPDRMELLIVDGLSDDDTVAQINNYKLVISNLSVLSNPDRTVPHAMNLGIANAKGDIILRFDGHAIMEPDYVSNCVKYLEQINADNVGGPAINISNGTAIGDAILLSHNSAFGLGGGAFRMGNYDGYTDTVTFGCFPKETFAKHGLYDTRLTRNQDIELNSRIRKGITLKSKIKNQKSKTEENDLRKSAQSADREAPGKIYLTPKIKSYYYCRNTLSGLWSQNFKNGQWVVYTKYIAPYALSLRHFIPLLFVTTILFLIIASLTSGTGFSGPTPPYPPRSGEGLVNGFGRIALLLLVIELVAYFGAMLFFVGKAGCSGQRTADRGQAALSEKRKAESGKGTGESGRAALSEKRKAESGKNDQVKAGQSIHNGDTMGKQLYDNSNTIVSQSSVNGMSTVSPPHDNILAPLLLLPIVFMTLHFSYGLGSLWGLATLPYFSIKSKVHKV